MNPDLDALSHSLADLIPLFIQWIATLSLAIARPLALIAVMPVFSRAQVEGLLRGGIAAALCLPMLPELHVIVAGKMPTGTMLLLLSLKEAALGTILGLLLGAPFWALDVAGDVLDLQRGSNQGRIEDPSGGDDVSIMGTFLFVVGVVLFAVSGGLEVMASSLYRSWRIWPVLSGVPVMNSGTPDLLLGMLDELMRQALRLAVPVILAMLLADFALILVGRVAQGLRVDNQALAARNLAFFLFLPLYSAFMIFYMRQDFALMPYVVDAMSQSLPGVKP